MNVSCKRDELVMNSLFLFLWKIIYSSVLKNNFIACRLLDVFLFFSFNNLNVSLHFLLVWMLSYKKSVTILTLVLQVMHSFLPCYALSPDFIQDYLSLVFWNVTLINLDIILRIFISLYILWASCIGGFCIYH